MSTGTDLIAAIARGINAADLDAVDRIFTPDAEFTQYRHMGGVVQGGVDTIKEALVFSTSIFPGVRIETSDVTDGGDRLAFLMTASIPDPGNESGYRPAALAPVFIAMRDGKVAKMTIFGRLIQPSE